MALDGDGKLQDTQNSKWHDKEVKINCIFDLFQALGGCYTIHRNGADGSFRYDSSSLEVVAKLCNMVGYRHGDAVKRDEKGNLVMNEKTGRPERNPDVLESQENVWQPLKFKYIAAIDYHSSNKNGVENLRGYDEIMVFDPNRDSEKFAKGLNKIYTIKSSRNEGELNDANHNVTEGDVDVAESTQVIAALEAWGLAHDTVKLTY